MTNCPFEEIPEDKWSLLVVVLIGFPEVLQIIWSAIGVMLFVILSEQIYVFAVLLSTYGKFIANVKFSIISSLLRRLV